MNGKVARYAITSQQRIKRMPRRADQIGTGALASREASQMENAGLILAQVQNQGERS